MRDIRLLFQKTGGLLRFLLLLFLRCPFDALYTTVQAIFLLKAFDAIANNDQNGLSITCLYFFIGSFLLFLYNGTVWRLYAVNTARWMSRLRMLLFRHISGLPLLRMEEKPSGEWITRLNADVQAASAMVNQPIHLAHFAVAAVNTLISSVVILTINKEMFGLILLFVIPHALISQFLVARQMTGLSAKVLEAAAENTADLNTILNCADTALLYDAQPFFMRCFQKSSLEIRSANMKMRRRSAIAAGLLPLMGMTGYLVLLLAGGVFIAKGDMTFGTLTAVFQFRGGMLLGFMMFLNSMINIKTALAGVRRVNETLQISQEE